MNIDLVFDKTTGMFLGVIISIVEYDSYYVCEIVFNDDEYDTIIIQKGINEHTDSHGHRWNAYKG